MQLKQLAEIRKNRGWSQSKLAREADLNAGTVCQIEKGRQIPYPIQREKIANALGLGVEEIDFGQLTYR